MWILCVPHTMVRIMKKSSHPGERRMKNRVYSLNKQHIQEKTCTRSQSA